LLSFHDWFNTIVLGTPAAVAEGSDESPDPLGQTDRPETRVVARGIRIVTSDIPAIVSNLTVARVEFGEIGLDRLNRETLERLRKEQRLETVFQFEQHHLLANDDFIIVLDGKLEDLPPDVAEKGNFLLLDRPDLLEPGRELFISAQSQAGEATVGAYAIVNN